MISAMPRQPRFVVPGLAHHVTQRGVRRTALFEGDDHRALYVEFLRAECDRFGAEILAWCLMTNHVHLVAVPEREESLARAVGGAHRRYTRARNFSEGVRGHLFEGRFRSCVLDERHLMAAARYVELNPVAAGIVDTPDAYAWSSASYHLGRRDTDPLVADRTMRGLLHRWGRFLREGVERIEARRKEWRRLEEHASSGMPLGDERFLGRLERRYDRRLRPGKGGWPKGRPRKAANAVR